MTMACGFFFFKHGMEKTIETDRLKSINKISPCLDTRGVAFLKAHKIFPISTDKFAMTGVGEDLNLFYSA